MYLVELIRSTIEKNTLANGNLTHANVTALLKENENKSKEQYNDLERKMDLAQQQILAAIRGNHTPVPVHEVDQNFLRNGVSAGTNVNRELHYWNKKYWHIPANFNFPKCT